MRESSLLNLQKYLSFLLYFVLLRCVCVKEGEREREREREREIDR